MRIQELIERLQRYDKDMECAYMLWLPDDVRLLADREDALTDDEIDEVLHIVEHTKDWECGITCHQISSAINGVINERKQYEGERGETNSGQPG